MSGASSTLIVQCFPRERGGASNAQRNIAAIAAFPRECGGVSPEEFDRSLADLASSRTRGRLWKFAVGKGD